MVITKQFNSEAFSLHLNFQSTIAQGNYDKSLLEKISSFLLTQVSDLLTTEPESRPTAEELELRRESETIK